MSSEIHDFAIIGGGMAGASIAAELAPHASLLLLEAEDTPGYHATGRSAAFWEECYGGPGVVPLTLASGDYLREHGFLKTRGALYIGREGERAELDDFERQFADTGVAIERIGRAPIAEKVPALREEWVHAIHEPACADIDVAGLHQHYLRAARRAGVSIACRAEVSALVREDGHWRIETRQGETYRAAQIVNAAGAWVDRIAALAGIRPLGIAPLRRTVVQLRVEPGPPADMPLVLDIGGAFYFKPEAGRLWLSPHDEVPSPPCDAAAEELDVGRVIDRLERATTWRIAAVERRWAGLRSFSPDRLPAYGRDAAEPSFSWFAGQGGFGIQTAPAAARLAAQALLGHAPDALTRGIDPARYDPARFAVVDALAPL